MILFGRRLGVGIHRLDALTARYGVKEDEERRAGDAQPDGMRRLKAELKRITEERDCRHGAGRRCRCRRRAPDQRSVRAKNSSVRLLASVAASWS
jgi:hypothetical protein